MYTLTLPHMDAPVSVFDLCQAHAQLESDYNVGGWLRERPSNQRRMMSTGSQLHRMKYRDSFRWVNVFSDRDEDGDSGDEDVKDVYFINVLKWGLPIDTEMRAFIGRRYTPEFLKTFPHWSQP